MEVTRMIELIRKNGVLYAKVLLNLRVPVDYKGKKYHKGEGLLLEEDVVEQLLIRNCDAKLYNGKEYVKINFARFREIMKKREYKAIDYVEPKKEEPPKPEPKVEVKEEVVKEEPIQQPVQEVKKEQPKQQNENNKKQRHNNNNKQGGDK